MPSPSSLLAFLFIYGNEKGIENPGFFFFGLSVAIFGSRHYSEQISALFRQKAKIVFSALLMIIAMTFMAMATGIAHIIVASLFFGCGYGMLAPTLQSWAVNNSPQNAIGAANATFLLSIDLGLAIGALLFGHISKWTGLSSAYLLCTIPLAMVIFLMVRPHPTEKLKPEPVLIRSNGEKRTRH